MARAAARFRRDPRFAGLGEVRPAVTRPLRGTALARAEELFGLGGLGQEPEPLAPAPLTPARRFTAKLRRVPWWVWVSSGGALTAAIVLYMKRDEIAQRIEQAGGDIFQAAAEVASSAVETVTTGIEETAAAVTGSTSWPKAARQYEEIINRLSAEYGVKPAITVAIGEHESNWGNALSPRGPAGTGDWVARPPTQSSAKAALDHGLAKLVTALPAPLVLADGRKQGWSPPRKNKVVLPPPYVIPNDELGWGRGLMQLDLANATGIDWTDPEQNIDKGLSLLAGALKDVTLRRSRQGVDIPDDVLLRIAIAGYNTYVGTAWDNYDASDPNSMDASTTGRNYSKDVLTKAASYDDTIEAPA